MVNLFKSQDLINDSKVTLPHALVNRIKVIISISLVALYAICWPNPK